MCIAGAELAEAAAQQLGLSQHDRSLCKIVALHFEKCTRDHHKGLRREAQFIAFAIRHIVERILE